MAVSKLLIANRGEIAIRIARSAAELGITTVAVYSADDHASLHLRKADDAIALEGSGAAAYLHGEQLVRVAREAGCDAIHPGYGFLSENAGFAQAVIDAGLAFIGPRPRILSLFGDKTAARAAAASAGVPILRGAAGAVTAETAADFLESLGPGGAIVLKAVAGGGGRGMRVVRTADAIASAYDRCRSEALAAFGNADIYAEEYLPHARHVEIQVAGDGSGSVVHFWDRECSLQRRHQKLIEIAPSPNLALALRMELIEAATRLASDVAYDNIGTFEFLVAPNGESGTRFAFIEANARLQVEHTVTEEMLDIDLVQIQLEIAGGRSLDELELAQGRPLGRGFALQARVCMETMAADGGIRPSQGQLKEFEPPAGAGIRVDSFGYRGYTTSANFDSLLAKVIVRSQSASFAACAEKAGRALSEFRIEGVNTNLTLLQSILADESVRAGDAYTGFIEDHLGELVSNADSQPQRFVSEAGSASMDAALAGNQVDRNDPLAILTLGKTRWEAPKARETSHEDDLLSGRKSVRAPLQGTVIAIDVAVGDAVEPGQQLCVLNAMKMEHIVSATVFGTVTHIGMAIGDTVMENSTLMAITVDTMIDPATRSSHAANVDLDAVRPELAEINDRRTATLDAARPTAVAKRRATEQRTARENIEDLIDPDSFLEYGQLAVAAHSSSDSIEEMVRRSPADGFICGVATVNSELFGAENARCAVLSYDYTVFAGTQGAVNHHKHDRVFEVAEMWKLPVIFFTEGGGGRSGGPSPARLSGQSGMRTTNTFKLLARLSGFVPLVAISSGRNFAGSAAILGPCDVVIATRNANIGMGGPAVIEGGGLGVFRPEEIGPVDVLAKKGVVDILVDDEAEGVRVAKQYISYFQGRTANYESADQRQLRTLIPENRVGSSRVDLQACKLEYSIVSPK